MADPDGFGGLEHTTLSPKDFIPKNGNGKKNKYAKKWKKTKINSLIWCANAIRGKESSLKAKLTREVALTIFSSFYGGTLVPSRQEHWEDKLGLNPGTLTKYSATRGLAIFTYLEYVGAFNFIKPILNSIPGVPELGFLDKVIEYGFWGNFAVSASFNLGVRYTLSKLKGKRIPPASLYAILPNSVEFAGIGVSKTYNKIKEPLTQKIKSVWQDYQNEKQIFFEEIYGEKNQKL